MGRGSQGRQDQGAAARCAGRHARGVPRLPRRLRGRRPRVAAARPRGQDADRHPRPGGDRPRHRGRPGADQGAARGARQDHHPGLRHHRLHRRRPHQVQAPGPSQPAQRNLRADAELRRYAGRQRPGPGARALDAGHRERHRIRPGPAVAEPRVGDRRARRVPAGPAATPAAGRRDRAVGPGRQQDRRAPAAADRPGRRGRCARRRTPRHDPDAAAHQRACQAQGRRASHDRRRRDRQPGAVHRAGSGDHARRRRLRGQLPLQLRGDRQVRLLDAGAPGRARAELAPPRHPGGQRPRQLPALGVVGWPDEVPPRGRPGRRHEPARQLGAGRAGADRGADRRHELPGGCAAQPTDRAQGRHPRDGLRREDAPDLDPQRDVAGRPRLLAAAGARGAAADRGLRRAGDAVGA